MRFIAALGAVVVVDTAGGLRGEKKDNILLQNISIYNKNPSKWVSLR